MNAILLDIDKNKQSCKSSKKVWCMDGQMDGWMGTQVDGWMGGLKAVLRIFLKQSKIKWATVGKLDYLCKIQFCIIKVQGTALKNANEDI